MFRKFVTTVYPDGRVTVDKNRDTVSAENVERDMAEERRRITNIARDGARARIETVEQTMTTLVIIYVAGTVKVYHWVPEEAVTDGGHRRI
jgi:hypothetical protein